MSLSRLHKRITLPLLFLVAGFSLSHATVLQAQTATRAELLARIKELIQIVEQLRVLLAIEQGQTTFVAAPPKLQSFTRTLRPGDTGAEVYQLQVFLNRDPDTRVAISGAGSPGLETFHFGTLTEDAVKRFQRKHSNYLLRLYGFSTISGIWDERTRENANKIIAQINATSSNQVAQNNWQVPTQPERPVEPPRGSGGSSGGGGGSSGGGSINNPPTIEEISASPSSIILPANTATLSVTASDDGPTGSLTYSWVRTAGPSGGVSIANQSSATATATFIQAGTYTFEVTVNDGSLNVKRTTSVTVSPAESGSTNQPPAITSISASPSSITLPTDSVSLSVTATDDGLPTGSSLSYSWTRTDGPSSGVSISNNTSANATATFSQAGSYTFRATVSDGALSANQTVSVTVSPQPSGGGGEVEYENRTYSADNTTDFLNPERGWYVEDGGGLGVNKQNAQPVRGHIQNVTLQMHYVNLSDYRNIDTLPTNFLNNLENTMESWRTTGKKAVLRFAYNRDGTGLDAPWSRMSGHIDQLSPLLHEYKDVIGVFQAGFIGSWGEMHQSSNGIAPSNANGRAFVNKILDATPGDMIVQFRTPYWMTTTLPDVEPLSYNERFTETKHARIGHYNDCIAAGQWWVTWWGDTPELTAQQEMDYAFEQGRLTSAGGETCSAGGGISQWNDAPLVISQFESGGWDYLNSEYWVDMYEKWDNSSHLGEISRRLGYRLRLTNASLPVEATSGAEVTIQFTMANDGFGKVYNPRPIDLVLRPSSGADINVRLTPDARRDLPLGGESKTLSYTVTLPTLSNGNYNLYLALPDPSPNLEDDPRYSIRLANTGTWVNASGLNNLNTVMVVGGGGGEPEPPQNQPPAIQSISATPSPITLPTNTVSLSVTATDDGLPTGSSLSYSWERIAGPTSVNISNALSPTASASFSVADTYTFQVTVSDGVLSTSQTVSVTVNEEQTGGTILGGVGSTSTSLVDFPKTGSVTTGDWYVDINSGVDSSGRGSSVSTPVRTIGYAISQASAGQTILVREGTYPLSSAIALNKELKLFGYGNERPVLDRGFGGTTTGNASYALRLQGGGTHFKGFTITGTPERGDALDSTRAVNFESANNIVEDVWVTGNRSGNIYSFGHSNNVVQDVRIWNNVMLTDVGTNSPDGISGTHSSGSVISGMAIVRSMVANAGDDGYDLYRAVNSSIIDSVSIGAGYRPDGSSTGGDGGGFKMGGGVSSGANTLKGSVAVGNRATGLNNNSTPGSSNTFEGNTSYLNRQGAIGDTGTAPTWRNNIAYANTNYNTSVAGGTQQNNSWQQGTPNPLFADADGGDLSLGSGSPYRGTGTGGSHMGASDIALEIYLEWHDHPEIYNPASDSEPPQVPDGPTDDGWGLAMWKMDFETGDVNDWNTPYPGHTAQDPGSFQNSGNSTIDFTTTQPRRGNYSAALTSDFREPGEHGARMFRGRFEAIYNPDGLYYSAWYYIPQHYATPEGWWNIWQWKSEGTGDSASEPTWVLDLLDQGDGSMALRLRDKTSGDTQYYPQSAPMEFPTGEWVHIEGFLKPSNSGDGIVRIWQNDEPLWNFEDVNTVRPGSIDSRWSANNYGENVGAPSNITIYVDDVAISTEPLGNPEPFDPVPGPQSHPLGPQPVTSTPVGQGTHFVSASGSGSSCTQANPCSIQTAISQSGPGDVVFLRGGTYNLSGPLHLSTAGTAGNPVTFESYPGERAVFDGQYNDSTRILMWQQNNYLVLRNISVTRMTQSGGVYVQGSNNLFDGVHSYNNRASGFAIYSDYDLFPYGAKGSHNTIRNCVVYGNSDVDTPAEGDNADGISVSSGEGNKVLNCLVYANSDDGIDAWRATNTEFAYNIIHSNGLGPKGNGNGIKAGGPSPSNYTLVHHNISYDNRSTGIDQNSGANVSFFNNVSWGNNRGYVIGLDTIVRNNISFGNNISHSGTGINSHNTWNSGFSVSANDFESLDPNSPLFFVLKSGSSLINAGTNVGLPYNGSAPDIGAVESNY